MFFSYYLCIFAQKQKAMKYSIITINYNNVEGLSQTIKSIVSQTFIDYEFIIIDGGSTDGSVELIKQYTANITYWVSEKDNGIYNAMNKGIIHAQGEYCIFMNSGDYFYDDNVLKQINVINAEEDVIVGKVSINRSGMIMSPPPIRELSLYHLYSGAIPHQGAFIRTSLLKKYPYDESLRIAADWKFFVQTLILNNCSIRYLDEYIAIYDINGISSTSQDLMQEEKNNYLSSIFPPRVLADYKHMKASECKTQLLTPLLRKSYTIDRILYSIGTMLLKLKQWIK